jgi:Zn/Cd-binding protein ZinT
LNRGSIFRYVKDVQISPEHISSWRGKWGGSIKRKEKLEAIAYQKAKNEVKNMTNKEKLLFIAALYWAEGGKRDFNFTNSDPKMIKIFVDGVRKILKINSDEIKVSIRIYEDLDRERSLDFWAQIVDIPKSKFINVNVLKGKKTGKLKYGLCRVRIKKGGNMLKYLSALNNRVSEIF